MSSLGRFRASALVFVLALRVVVTASAAPRDAAEAVPGNHAVILEVPLVKQLGNYCGAASLAMVTEYWAGAIGGDGPEVMREVTACAVDRYSTEARGVRGRDLESCLQQSGRFVAFAFEGTVEDLTAQLGRGRPLIACLAPSRPGRALHYVVVTGVDGGGSVLINDPRAGRRRSMTLHEFGSRWAAAGRWTLLAIPGTDSDQRAQ